MAGSLVLIMHQMHEDYRLTQIRTERLQNAHVEELGRMEAFRCLLIAIMLGEISESKTLRHHALRTVGQVSQGEPRSFSLMSFNSTQL